jgi:poly-gamma-glutamate synthesis protein (capsule biosynthesis protein)
MIHSLKFTLPILVSFVAMQAHADISVEAPVKVTFVGDIMLDGGPGHLITNNGDPFAYVAPILQSADITIGNLECAITSQGHAQDKPYTFKGPNAALPLIKKHFTAVSLANNHSGDWGPQGFADELTLLQSNEIAWFGGGRNERLARRPFVTTVRGQTIAVLGYNEFPPKSFAATANRPGTAWFIEKKVIQDIKDARQQTHADWVVLYLHWGEELEQAPTNQQVETAHRLIEAGADIIIGGHPHVTQTIEWYQSKPIVYSLGNFVFDYFPHDPPVWTSYILQLTLSKGNAPVLSTTELTLDAAGVPHLI